MLTGEKDSLIKIITVFIFPKFSWIWKWGYEIQLDNPVTYPQNRYNCIYEMITLQIKIFGLPYIYEYQ